MSLYLVLSSRLPSWLAMAAAFFNMAYEVIISRGIRSLPMLKCSSERWVCAPQSLSAGTSTSPRLSVSLRMSVILFSFRPAFEPDLPDCGRGPLLELHFCSESENNVVLRCSTRVRVILSDGLQK